MQISIKWGAETAIQKLAAQRLVKWLTQLLKTLFPESN